MPRILYVQYTNPACYPPLEHSSRILADLGWNVRFLGTWVPGTEAMTFPPHAHIDVRLLRYCPPGWRQKLHYLRFCLWVFATVVLWRPRWIYISETLACPIGWLVSFLPGRRVILHEHDSPAATNPSRFLRWCLRMRGKLARRARLCILPNAERLERFREQTSAERTQCVWNVPARNEVSAARTESGEEIWLLYHGSITPPQLPLCVMDALKTLPARVKLRVIGYETEGHRGYVQALKDRAEQVGVAERVAFLGTLPRRADILPWCHRSDIGLVLFARTWHQPMAGASNKPFDYLSGGCALLVSDAPEWRTVFEQPGYARTCNPEDAESITASIGWYLEHLDEMRAMGEAGRQRILREWNYEEQFAPVVKMLEQDTGGNAR